MPPHPTSARPLCSPRPDTDSPTGVPATAATARQPPFRAAAAAALSPRTCAPPAPRTPPQVIADVIAAKLWDGEVCLYGNNCGMHCTHDSYDESDPLDKACYDHDRCLEGASTQDAICACDDTLVRDADAVRPRGCCWEQPGAGHAVRACVAALRRACPACCGAPAHASSGSQRQPTCAHPRPPAPPAAPQIASSDDGSDMARTAVSVRDGIATFGKTVHGCYF